MKAKWWCAFLACLTVVTFIHPCRAQAQAVHAWEGTITIPTYKLGPTDPDPPFPLVNSQPVYPYTMLDDLTDDRAMQQYKAIYLENQYLKITILPQLGGHVYSVYDKIDHREVLYRDHVIKYGLVGPRGAWISGGMEFSFPFAHTTDTVSTVESTLHHNPDGSATSIVGALDWVSNMHWEIAITLRPDTARIEEGVTLFNSTPVNNLYLFWTNTAVKATDDTHYIYPMRETIDDNPFAVVQSWPKWHGVDESWYKNDPSALAIFGRDVHRNFFGVYYQQANYGIVHVADFRQNPGKKLWTWGTAPVGKIWDHILSDNDGSYNEIQSGRFYTQGYREFMNPRRVEQWTEYWYPVRGLDGGFVEATSQMAINANYADEDHGRPEVRLTVSPVADIPDATVEVKEGANLLKQISHVHFQPLQTAMYSIPVKSLDDAKKNLNVQILSPEKKVLLAWSASEPVDGNPDLQLMAGRQLAKPIEINQQTPLEELYLQGVFLQKTGNLQKAMQAYDQVLAKDPGYIQALMKEAWYHYRAADFDQALSLMSRATARNNEDPLVAYATGVISHADGHMSLAKDSFWTSIYYGTALPPGSFLAASFVELGEIAIYQRDFSHAIALLRQAVSYNPGDAFALADLAVAEQLNGNSTAALQHSTEAVKKMPLLPYALAENYLDQNRAASAASDDSNKTQSWTQILSSDPQNYLAVAAWYHNLGAWKSSDQILHIAKTSSNAQDMSSMIDYYLASNARHEGETQQAATYARQAAVGSMTDVFPNRLADVAVLKEAIDHAPTDAHAKYALGNFLFAKGRYDDAAQLWQAALHEGFNNAVLLRNLGVYEWHVRKNLPQAAEYYARAIQLTPNQYRLYPELDEIYELQGNMEARTKLFQDAPPSVLDQDTVRARHALLLMEQSKYNQALAILVNHRFKPWEGGVVIHNMFVFANMERGQQALANHNPQEAEKAFRQAMLYPDDLGTGEPAQPDMAEQLYWLGNALQAEGKTADATAMWTRAAEQGKTATNLPAVYSALAYRKLGQNEKATGILDRVVQAATRPEANAGNYFAAGMAERYSGNAKRAQQNFRKALALNPLFWQARIALENSNRNAKSDA